MDHSTLFTIATEVLVHVRVFIDSRIRIAPIRAAQKKKEKKMQTWHSHIHNAARKSFFHKWRAHWASLNR